MNVILSKKAVSVSREIDCLDLALTLDCGQAFRWKNQNGIWHGIIGKKVVDVFTDDKSTVFCNITEDEYNTLIYDYFDLGRNYAPLLKKFSQDENLRRAIDAYPGIRVLRQDTWEALCSFIISQNNNIPRIKGIIERLCQSFGENLGGDDYSFPGAETLCSLSPEDLAPLRAGFRAKYIIDAAKKTASGEINLNALPDMPLDEARNELLKIKGVGPKVADCVLLFGCGKVDAFPIDVWVKRVMAEMYPNGLPECVCGASGIAQQYLFHWRRNLQ